MIFLVKQYYDDELKSSYMNQVDAFNRVILFNFGFWKGWGWEDTSYV
jgi:hypothetical protein